MTATRRWLEARSSSIHRSEAAAVIALVLGMVLAAFGVGLLLGRMGVYLLAPAAVF